LQPRYLLPKDLAGALKRLSDDEVDALLAAAIVEARRRARPQRSQPQEAPIDPKAPHRRLHVQGEGTLTTGKLNAVRAAFKAGVKPSAIARQFGISKSDVGKALAEARNRKSGR
jgi:DNA invertase Pin-like site-specific DNA recombinase